ncbi:hypothetical protein D516_2101 [Rhodobacter sp. AKP1]|nr:hypothetical protein D516_2101 [Rhodobacter sp. AKP1]
MGPARGLFHICAPGALGTSGGRERGRTEGQAPARGTSRIT